MSAYANGPSIIALSVVLPVLGILSVGARFFIRKTHRQGIGLDDWLILPALVCSIGFGISLIIGTAAQSIGYPMGATGENEITNQTVELQKIVFAALLLNIVGIGFAKLSLLYFYRRVFHSGTKGGFDITTKVLVVIVGIWSIAFFFLYIFQCTANITIQWGSVNDQATYCLNQEIFNLFLVSSDLFLDLILFVLPIPLIVRLDFSVARKCAILLVFCVGALTVVASAIRVAILSLIYQGITNNFTGVDEILIASEYMFWTMLETGLAVIVPCLPILQIWIRKISTEAVGQNARGVFSMQSLPQSTRNDIESEMGYPVYNRDSDAGSFKHTFSRIPID